MSAGSFVRAFYQLSSENGGGQCSCRVQPETIAAFPGASGPATIPVTARMGGSRRKFGVNARYISGKWTGAVPDGYDPNGTIRIPILTPTAFAAISVGDTVSYLGSDLEVVGKNGETVK